MSHRWFTHTGFIAFLILILGCTALGIAHWDREYGPSKALEPHDGAPAAIDYHSQIRPLLEQRCVVCHGCFDAPCQLKMESYEGLLRGAHKDPVYNGSRLLGAKLTRLYEDAQTTEEWREMSFYPVLNERKQTPEANLEASVMARLLQLKQDHPLPDEDILPDSFDFAINRDQQCPRIENFNSYARDYPLWGMPYGLPGLNEAEHQLLMDWLEMGAPPGPELRQNPVATERVQEWEAFLNGDSLKQQLTNRYLYEHLFLANLYFEELPGTYFKLVRSKTPPGQPIERISTRRPFDDPGVKRVYYRLWQDPSSIVAKLHLPYALSNDRRKNWEKWFLNDQVQVTHLPDYTPETAANPFATFVDLPVEGRYRFLLDEAQFTIMNFIKGPVCRGQIALNVIQDQFWVYFVNPDTMDEREDSRFLSENSDHLNLPAEVGNTLTPLSNWRRYSELQQGYLNAKASFIKQRADEAGGIDLGLIWDGNGNNANAALTIFRHNDSASVVQGLVGDLPKTAWVIDYPLLERIHYLLVAGFDVYGNASHQLLSRLYMDFLRMEGEMNFVALLPEQSQRTEIADWYRNAEDDLRKYLDIYLEHIGKAENRIPYRTEQHKQELFGLLEEHLSAVAYQGYALPNPNNQATRALQQLQGMTGKHLNHLPQATLIKVPELGVFSLLHNNAYSNLSSMLQEEKRRVPAEDSTTLTFGVLGAYPNSLMWVKKEQLPDFVRRIANLDSEQDYQALRNHYGIRRSHPEFWRTSDLIHAWYVQNQPEEAGLLDYNRLENR